MNDETQDDSDSTRAALAAAIGTLVIQVSALEESLHDGIRLTVDGDTATDTLTAGLPLLTLVEKFGALCVQLQNARVPTEEVRAFCTHVNGLIDDRNAIIHAAWHLREGSPPQRFRRTAKPKSGFAMTFTESSVAEVTALAEAFRQAEMKLWEIVKF